MLPLAPRPARPTTDRVLLTWLHPETPVNPLERDQAAILTLYTGVICGPVEDAHQLAEVLLGRPVLLHELGSGEVSKQVHELVRPVFEVMAANVAMPDPTWPAPPEPG